MDVTCGILFSTDSSTMAQLECALLASNYDEIEKYAKKLKKKHEISPGLEIILDCYVNIHRQVRLHAASLELDLTHLLAYQVKNEICESIKEKLKKVLMLDMESSTSELELKLAYVLLGVLSFFRFDGGKDSLNDSLAYFDKIDFDLSKKFLLYEQGDTEITQSTLIEKIFGILGLFFRGLALELLGHKEHACEQYQVISEFLIRFRVQQFTQSKSVHDFICAALYRSGCLLNQLAQFKESAAIFRSFLNFFQVNPQIQLRHPSNSTIRLLRALSQYMDLLDRKFRTYNFKTFCDEYSSTYNTMNNVTWQADNVQEELILCSMLLLTIPQNQLVRQTLEDLRIESSVLRRFARIGYLEGITRIQKTHFQSKTGSIEIYRNLFHSLMSAGKRDLASLSARMYLQGNGKDPFTLLLIAKLYLSLPTKLDAAWEILETILNDCEKLDIGMQVPYFLLRGQFYLIKSRRECPFTVTKVNELLKKAEAELSLVLQVDESNAEAYFYLSLVAYESFDLERSERHIKKSLSIDSSQSRAWNLFAVLKSAKKDYASVLNICNTELSNMIQKDRNLSLLRVSALLPLNRSDEAIETLKRIISAHFRKSNDFKMDGGMTVISEGTLGPGNFLSKFLGDLNGSHHDFGTVTGGSSINTSNSGIQDSLISQYNGKFDMLLGIGKGTTFSGYTESFPQSLEEYLISTLSPESISDPLRSKSIPLKDLAAIQDNDCFTITSLWVEVATVYLHEGLLQDAEAALNQAYVGNEVFAPIFGTFGLIEEARAASQDSRGDENRNLTEPERLVSVEDFYRKGLSISDQDEICLLGLSRVLIRSNDPSKLFESECLVRKLIQLDPSNPEAWSILAQCCSRTGRFEEAMGYFDSALKKEIISPLRSIRSIY